ncbi:hypothetical protein QCA50_001013 [Cerrena zonata]|uniref:Uncharacterized protein n=1 Tax=Cerrena zonata TaxID=2478898 RepID=A0AAW0GW17_9APHY
MLRPSQTEEQFDTNFLSARPPVILSRENSSSTLSGSFVTARDELPPYIPESVLYHAGQISRSESSLGLSGLEVDTHHVYPVSTELNDSSPNWGTPQGSPAPSIWYPPAEVLSDD